MNMNLRQPLELVFEFILLELVFELTLLSFMLILAFTYFLTERLHLKYKPFLIPVFMKEELKKFLFTQQENFLELKPYFKEKTFVTIQLVFNLRVLATMFSQ